MSAARKVLPARRPHEVIDFELMGRRYVAGVGRGEDGEVFEVFLNGGKSGSDADVNARDGAIALSLLLQFGCPLDTIRRALTRNPDGSAAGPIGELLDILAKEDGE